MRSPLLVAALLAAALSMPAPSDAADDHGRPACDYCRMIMVEKSFGGEMSTAAFERLIFDSAECMAAYWLAQRADTASILTMRVVSFDRPSERLEARIAIYLRSAARESPMGLDLSAYPTVAAAKKARGKNSGQILTWPEVKNLVIREWFGGKRP